SCRLAHTTGHVVRLPPVNQAHSTASGSPPAPMVMLPAADSPLPVLLSISTVLAEFPPLHHGVLSLDRIVHPPMKQPEGYPPFLPSAETPHRPAGSWRDCDA